MSTATVAKIDFTSAMFLNALKGRAKGRATGTKSYCAVCGKEESRNSKAVNDVSPNHSMAADQKLLKRSADIEKRLADKTTTLDDRKVLTDAANDIDLILVAARKEHDLYNEQAEIENKQQSVSDKRKLIELAQSFAGKLGLQLTLTHTVNVPEETIEETATVDGVEVKTTKTVEAHTEEQDRSPLMLFTDVAAAFDALVSGKK